jgi:hypothetical protein
MDATTNMKQKVFVDVITEVIVSMVTPYLSTKKNQHKNLQKRRLKNPPNKADKVHVRSRDVLIPLKRNASVKNIMRGKEEQGF